MQLAPQSVGMAPPKPSIVAGKAYSYDVEYRTGLVSATLKGQDIAGVSVITVPMCPGGLAARVTGTGVVKGFDMYGQYCSETLAGASNYTYARVIEAPAGATWLNVFGLPYKWASGGTVNTYTPPAGNGDPRGTVAPATPGNDIELDYIADRDELYGEPLANRFASGDRIADAATTATIDLATGAVVVTTAAVADGSDALFWTMPDGTPVETSNGAGSANYTLPPLWVSKYRNTISNGANTELIRGVSRNGTNIVVTSTVSNGGGVDVIVEPPMVQQFGPFSAGGDGTEFWTRSDCMIGFDVDSDPDPDTWHTWNDVMSNENVSQETKDAIMTQLQSQGCPV